jgi:hypothetical protein
MPKATAYAEQKHKLCTLRYFLRSDGKAARKILYSSAPGINPFHCNRFHTLLWFFFRDRFLIIKNSSFLLILR